MTSNHRKNMHVIGSWVFTAVVNCSNNYSPCFALKNNYKYHLVTERATVTRRAAVICDVCIYMRGFVNTCEKRIK